MPQHQAVSKKRCCSTRRVPLTATIPPLSITTYTAANEHSRTLPGKVDTLQEEVTQNDYPIRVEVGKARRAYRTGVTEIQKFWSRKAKTRAWETDHAAAACRTRVFPTSITDSNIKAFESTAKKYNIDFSLKRLREGDPLPCVFQGRDADVMTPAFQEFSAKKLNREKSPIRKALARCKGQGEAA